MIADILHKIAGMQPEETRPYAPRMSSTGPERCIRQLTYHALGNAPERARGARMYHVLDDSSWHEELSSDWIGKSAYQLHSRQLEVSIPGVMDWMPDTEAPCSTCGKLVSARALHGHIDGIVTDMLGKDRLWEHKALNHFTFERYWKAETFPEDYFAQCACYLRGLSELLPNLNEAIMLVKNKNTSGFLEYLLRYDQAHDTLTALSITRHTGDSRTLDVVRPNITTQAVEKFRTIARHAAEQTLPERPYEMDDWHCEYCPYQETCWAGYGRELGDLAEDAELSADLADTVRYYKQLGGEITDQEKEREALRRTILDRMKEAKIKSGRSQEYIVDRSMMEKRTVKWDDLPLALQQQIEPHRTVSRSEVLRIRKLTKETA